jgi:hypothetical protein
VQVIDSLVRHFMRCHDDERQMPVVWHQTLLCFVQRYRDDIRAEDRELLRKLTQVRRETGPARLGAGLLVGGGEGGRGGA